MAVDITKISSLPYLGTTAGTKAQSGSGTTTDGTSADEDNAELLKNQFLGILLTQMQNQNPLDPMDTKEFTGQLAQFSALEQQINTNDKLSNLLTAVQSSAASSAFTYIGQTAELDSKMTVIEDGAVDWNYALKTNADTVTVKIKDSTGKVLYEKDLGATLSGTYSLNATKAELGSELADGEILTLEVTGKTAAGVAVPVDISTTVKVDGVESSADGIDLRSGGLLYSLEDVLRFKTVTTPTTPTTTT